MAYSTKPTISKLFLIIAVPFSLVYCVTSLSPYINPIFFWPLTFLSLGFPIIALGMLLIVCLSFFLIRKYSWIFCLFFFIGTKNIQSCFAFHFNRTFNVTKQKDAVRILSWNVNQFVDSQVKYDTAGNPRRKMLAYIQQMNPDILCFQDFTNFSSTGFRNSINYTNDSLQYPYHFFAVDYRYNNIQSDGLIIFSRYPIVDSASITYEGDPTQHFEYADILIDSKKVRLFNVHLLSMDLHGGQAHSTNQNFFKPDTALLLHKHTFKKLKYFDKIHVSQAVQIKTVLDTTLTPFIFCADLNSVPSSYIYHCLSNGLQDAFLKTNMGLGATYDSISPTLRIDVVLMNKLVKPLQHTTPHLHLSDHYPNVVDIKLN